MYMENATGKQIADNIGNLSVDTSGLVKDATLQAQNTILTQIKTSIDNLSFNDLFIIKNYSCTWSWASGDSRSFNLTANDFNISTPTGYTPVTLLRIGTGALYSYLRSYNIQATTTQSIFGFYYSGTADVTATATIVIAYVKTSAIQ